MTIRTEKKAQEKKRMKLKRILTAFLAGTVTMGAAVVPVLQNPTQAKAAYIYYGYNATNVTLSYPPMLRTASEALAVSNIAYNVTDKYGNYVTTVTASDIARGKAQVHISDTASAPFTFSAYNVPEWCYCESFTLKENDITNSVIVPSPVLHQRWVKVSYNKEPYDAEDTVYTVYDNYGTERGSFTSQEVWSGEAYFQNTYIDYGEWRIKANGKDVFVFNIWDGLSFYIPAPSPTARPSPPESSEYSPTFSYGSITDEQREILSAVNIEYDIMDGKGNLIRTVSAKELADGVKVPLDTERNLLYEAVPRNVPRGMRISSFAKATSIKDRPEDIILPLPAASEWYYMANVGAYYGDTVSVYRNGEFIASKQISYYNEPIRVPYAHEVLIVNESTSARATIDTILTPLTEISLSETPPATEPTPTETTTTTTTTVTTTTTTTTTTPTPQAPQNDPRVEYTVHLPDGATQIHFVSGKNEYLSQLMSVDFFNSYNSDYYIIKEHSVNKGVVSDCQFVWFPYMNRPDATYFGYIPTAGDADLDGTITANDIAYLRDYVMYNINQLSPQEYMAADANRDGKIDASDIDYVKALCGQENGVYPPDEPAPPEQPSEPDIPDNTPVSPPSYYGEPPYLGIDVSHWQGDIDWQRVKNAGMDFAIIQAGYGNDISQEDIAFRKNITEAQAAGIQCGVYWYSYAVDAEDAVREAMACLEVIRGYDLDYPVFFDVEEPFQIEMDSDSLSAIVDAFCSTIESYGYYVSIYSSASFLNYNMNRELFDKYDVWVAHYGVDYPEAEMNYGIWQYDNEGHVDGIDGDVDMDISYVDYASIIRG